LDFFIENILPVEIKVVEYSLPVHEAQIISYLKLLEKPQGLLIYFNVINIFYKGQKTYVNEFYRNLND
jgi:GxxExxY protein